MDLYMNTDMDMDMDIDEFIKHLIDEDVFEPNTLDHENVSDLQQNNDTQSYLITTELEPCTIKQENMTQSSSITMELGLSSIKHENATPSLQISSYNRRSMGISRAICEIDDFGIIGRWPSMFALCSELGIKYKALMLACTQQHLIQGRRFQYADILPDPKFPNETWLEYLDTDDIYPIYVSNYARIRNHRNRILKQCRKGNRYYVRVTSKHQKKGKEKPLDRVVATTFLGPSHKRVIHIDGDCSNNHPENLKYE